MENLFQNAMWISFKSNARGKKSKVNPWENVIDAEIRKTDIEKGSGLPVFHKRFKLKEGIYKIYDVNKNFIGIGIIKNNLLKRDIVI